MKLFRKKHSVCVECGVHFEPVTGYEARWGQFCAAHRKAYRENDEKRDAVQYWAEKNWVRLYDQMLAEAEKEKRDNDQDSLTAQQQYMRDAMRRGLYASGSSNFNPFAGVL